MLEALISAHPVVTALLGYFIFSAIVTGMPPVDASSSKAYRWAYGSLNVLAANIGGMMHAKFPEMTTPLPENLPPGSAVVAEKTETVAIKTPE